MTRIDAACRVVTLMFRAGADPRQSTQLLPESSKGVLKFTQTLTWSVIPSEISGPAMRLRAEHEASRGCLDLWRTASMQIPR